MINKQHKIVVVGGYGVGKSCLIHRYIHKTFPYSMDSTLGVAYSCVKKEYNSSGNGEEKETVDLTIWDTAGQERFQSLLPMYLHHSDVCLICTDKPDLYSIEKWYQYCIREAPTARIILCITKFDTLGPEPNAINIDCVQRHDFSPVEEWCITNGVPIFYTCALHNINVDKVFDYILEKFIIGETVITDPPNENYFIPLDIKSKCC